MFKLFKPSNQYQFRSEAKVLFKTKRVKIELTEYYDPHYLEIYIWKRKRDLDAMFILKNWHKIPLSKHSRVLFKLSKLDNKVGKLTKQLEEICEKENAEKEKQISEILNKESVK